MDEESEAFRHWRDIVSSPPDDGAIRAGIDYALANIAEGRIFRPGEADPDGDLEGYAEFGLAAPLRRFWPKLTELVGGNEPLTRRMAELRDRVLIVELAMDGFAAGTRPFPDDSHLVQIDTGLFLTVFEVVQAFVEVCDPDPEVPPGQAERESAVVLELLLAEYRPAAPQRVVQAAAAHTRSRPENRRADPGRQRVRAGPRVVPHPAGPHRRAR